MMTNRNSALPILIFLAGLALPAQAQTPGDLIVAGRNLAGRVCGACHVVEQKRDELPVLAPPGPSFAVLAQRPQLTEAWLREFLGSTRRNMGAHEAMPNPRLRDYQVDVIVAFMMSLKPAI
jgi:mono/diheme cytochrome c family protein